jgi:hypothetical protein
MFIALERFVAEHSRGGEAARGALLAARQIDVAAP